MNEHDLLLEQARLNPYEGTPLSMFSDHLQEHGLPGGLLAREGAEHRATRFDPLNSDEEITSVEYPNPGGAYPHLVSTHPDPFTPGAFSVEGVRRLTPHLEPKSPVYIKGIWEPQSEGDRLEVRTPILSRTHLRTLTADMPDHMQQALHKVIDPYFPKDSEQFSRRLTARRLSRRK